MAAAVDFLTRNANSILMNRTSSCTSRPSGPWYPICFALVFPQPGACERAWQKQPPSGDGFNLHTRSTSFFGSLGAVDEVEMDAQTAFGARVLLRPPLSVPRPPMRETPSIIRSGTSCDEVTPLLSPQ